MNRLINHPVALRRDEEARRGRLTVNLVTQTDIAWQRAQHRWLPVVEKLARVAGPRM
jgi:hypothetical protein